MEKRCKVFSSELDDKKFVSHNENFAIIVLTVVYSTVCRKSWVTWLKFAAQRNKSTSLIFDKKLIIIRKEFVIKKIRGLRNKLLANLFLHFAN